MLIEVSGAAIGATSLFVAPGMTGWITAIFGWWLMLLASLDVEYQWLPHWGTLPLLTAGLFGGGVEIGPPVGDRLWGVAAGYASLTFIALGYRQIRSREGLGGGDPKLLAALGAWLGWQLLPYVIIGAGVIGLIAVLLHNRRHQRLVATDPVPLGAFLCVAAWPMWILIN